MYEKRKRRFPGFFWHEIKTKTYIKVLRIDNSGRSVIYTLYHNSETALVTITCNIPNKRVSFSLSFDRSVIVIRFGLRFF